MATEKNLNNLIINKVENQAVYDYMKINNLINADELYFISGADDNATETESGLMSAEDKIKLDGIQEGANKTVVDTALSSTSTNPVQNKVINTKFNTIQSNIDNKVPTSRTVNGKALTGNITLSASDVGALPSSTVIPSIDGLATETYVNNKVAGLVDSAPSTLDTLNELAAALGDDPNFATTIATQIGGKVDKVNGKGLSTNDYTTAEKQKLANIANGANNYTLPVATSSILGGIKSGTDITIDASGNVSINDDSHNHIISNVDGLQSALDGKSDTGHTHNNLVPTSRTVNGKALTSDISLIASDVGAISTTDGAVGTNNIASDAVQTGKIAAGAVTREKLAADALYSPLKTITADRNIEVDDLGKTLKPKYSSSSTTFTLTLNAVSSTSLPIGAEIAVCRLYDLNQVNIAFSGVRVIYLMGGRIANKDDNVAITVPRVGGMLAIKKMEIDTTYGDLWLVTGNVEVIS